MAVSGVSYSNQIKALKVGPLDGKSLAPNFASLRSPSYWVDLDNGLPYIKNGMIFSTEDGHIYQLLDRNNYTNVNAWKEIGVGGTGGTGESIDIDRYGKYAAIALYGVTDHNDTHFISFSGVQGLVNVIKDYVSPILCDEFKEDGYRYTKGYVDAHNLHLCCVPDNIYDLGSDVSIQISGTFENNYGFALTTLYNCEPFTDINITDLIKDSEASFPDSHKLNSLDIYCNKPFILDNGTKSSGLLNWIEL